MFLLNMLFMVALVAGYAASHVPPSTIWPLAFAGLGYPVSLAVNAAFVLYWILLRRRLFLLPLLVILAGYPYHTNFFQISLFDEKGDESRKTVRVMTYNARLFGLYKWEENTRIRNGIMDMLDREAPDVICFQEFFYSEKGGYFNTRDTLVKTLKMPYYTEGYTHHVYGVHHFGAATMSRYPIVNEGTIRFPSDENNICIYTDIRIGSDTVRFYNAHVGSIRFDPIGYGSVKKGGREKGESVNGVVEMGRKLKQAFLEREKQVRRILTHMEGTELPVVLCTDLNDTPTSYAYARLTEPLVDAFVLSGNGLGRSYAGKYPSFRIDHIMHSTSLDSYDHETLPEAYSDHYPVTCRIALPDSL